MRRENFCPIFFRMGICFVWLFALGGMAGAQGVLSQEQGEDAGERVLIIETDVDLDDAMRSNDEIVPPPVEEMDRKEIDMQAIMGNVELGKDQIIQLNRSLRKVIEENEKLIQQNKDLDKQLRNIRGQRTIESNRMSNLAEERDQYKEQLFQMKDLKERFEEDVRAFKERQTGKEKWLEDKVKGLQDQLVEAEEKYQEVQEGYAAPLVGEGMTSLSYMGKMRQEQKEKKSPLSRKARQLSMPQEEKGKGDILAMIEKIKEEKKRLVTDQARIHYKMGNKLFNEGRYDKAVAEYKKAVQLAPEDANAHFNLAYVSGNFLNDYLTALEHYRQYLILNPDAQDKNLVKEKILTAELFLRSEIPSLLERDTKKMRKLFFVQ